MWEVINRQREELELYYQTEMAMLDDIAAMQRQSPVLDYVARHTLIVDASWRNEFSGCAWWLNGDRGRSNGSAYFYSDSSGRAECIAVMLAVHDLVTQGLLQTGDRLLIQSDSEYALNREYVFPVLMQVEMRHVAGHTGDTDARSRAQAWCDRHARQVRQKLEEEYEYGK